MLFLLLLALVLSISLVRAAPREVEVIAEEAQLYALPLYALAPRYRPRNVIGTAAKGAKLTVVDESQDRYRVEIKTKEEKVKIKVWILKKDVK